MKIQIIRRDNVDTVNENYVTHQVRHLLAKKNWPTAVVIWGVFLGALAYLNNGIFCPDYYFFVAWIVIAFISKLMVGFDMGTRV